MQKLKSILSKVLTIKPDTIHDHTSPETVENWDSFNALMLVSELEREYQIKFTMDEIISVKKVLDIKNILRKNGKKIDG